MQSDHCLSCLSVTLVHCGQTVGRIKIILGVWVGLSPGHIVLDRHLAPPPLEEHSPCPLWPDSWMDQDGTWHGGGPRSRPHFAKWQPSSPFPKRKRGQSPPPSNFRPVSMWPNVWMAQDGTWHGGGPRSRPHCARWEPSSPQKGQSPPIFGTFRLWPNGWMDGWMKMRLVTEVGLGPGDITLDGDPGPPQKEHCTPAFGPCLLGPNGCMHQGTTWYGDRPQPRRHCVRWGPRYMLTSWVIAQCVK